MQLSKVDGMMYVGDINDTMMVKGTDPEEIRLQAWLRGAEDFMEPLPDEEIKVAWFRCSPCFCGEHGFHVDPVRHGHKALRGAWLGAEVRMRYKEDVWGYREWRSLFDGQALYLSTRFRYNRVTLGALRP